MNRVNNIDLIIQEYLNKYTGISNVVGIALTGSAGRGDRDKYSDIDAVVFIDSENKSELVEGKVDYQNILFDIRLSNIINLEIIDWSEDMYFAYLNSKLIYDRENQVSHLIEEKRALWKIICKSQVVLTIVNLSVIFDFDGWHGLNAESHYKKAILRRDIVSAHWILGNGLELLLKVAYLLAGNPPPDKKNFIKLLKNFSILKDENHLAVLNDVILVKSLKITEAAQRYESLMQIVSIIKQSVDLSDEEWPEDFYQFYLENR